MSGVRRADLDVIRAVALIGVCVMNYHGYLVLRGAPLGDDPLHRLFHPWEGPLATRFAATFVVVAGIGTSLLTDRVRRFGNDLDRIRARSVLAMRGVVLFVGGFFLDMIWPGTILWFYGLYFLVGALVVFASDRVVGVLAAAVVGATLVMQWIRLDGDVLVAAAERTDLRGALLWSVFDGTHPLLPWLAFYLVGVIVGRAWPRPTTHMLAAGAVLVGSGLLLSVLAPDTTRGALIGSLDPWTRSPAYVAETLGVALMAIAVLGAIAERTPDSPVTRALAATGRTTLTLYVAHALVFNLVVDWLEWIRPTGLDVALAFALGFWVVGVVVAVVVQARFGTGPVEWLYRAITGRMPRPDAPRPVSPTAP